MSTEIKAIVLQTKSKYAKMYAGSGNAEDEIDIAWGNKDYQYVTCLLYTSPSPRD